MFGVLHGFTFGLFIVFLATVVPLVVSILSHALIRRRGVAWCIATGGSLGAVWIPLLFVFRSELTEEGFRFFLLYGGLAAFVIALIVGTIAGIVAKRRPQIGTPHDWNWKRSTKNG